MTIKTIDIVCLTFKGKKVYLLYLLKPIEQIKIDVVYYTFITKSYVLSLKYPTSKKTYFGKNIEQEEKDYPFNAAIFSGEKKVS